MCIVAVIINGSGVVSGTTSIDGNANSASKLKTARTIRTNLVSTSTANFDGTANVTPSVTGTLQTNNMACINNEIKLKKRA